MNILGIKSRVLFLAIIPATMIAILLTTYSIQNSISVMNIALHERGRVIASQLAPASEYGVAAGNASILQPLVQQVMSHDSDLLSVLVTDPLGKVLAVSGRPVPESILQEKSTGIWEWDLGMNLVFTAPIMRSLVQVENDSLPKTTAAQESDSANRIGQVYVVLSTSRLMSLKSSLILHNLLIVIIGLAVSGFMAWRIGRGITFPIETMALAVRRLGEGQFGLRIPENSSGELQTLQRGFNTMASQLKEAHDEMQQRINEATRQLRHQAHHDDLTGLVNRREFERRLERVLKSTQEHGTHHVFCYMDLDQFKIVNDTCGHHAGDDLLRQISLLLNNRVRDRDTLARLGGDEFGLLLENCAVSDAFLIAEELREMVQDFRYIHQDKMFTIGVSIGMVAVTPDFNNIGSIMSAADTACYAAKDNGRNRIHLFQALDEEVTKRHGEMEWVGRITRAMEENQFCLFCQPILPIAEQDDSQRFYEILLRKHDVDGKLVPPMAFIPAAERYDLMVSIDRWVIRNTMASYRQLLDNNRNQSNCVFTINLSGVSLNDPSLLGYIHEQLTIFAVPPHAICFEITETSAIVNLGNTMDLMFALKKLGCRFLLDDFGSGMSSFAYLKNLPVDFLKMDGAYVKDIASNSIDLAMVQSIHSIAEAMKIKTIAEFVETAEVVELLQAIGVHYGQGFHLGRPIPLTQVIEDLRVV